MEKKNLIQRIGTNVGSFILGAALATGITYTATHQPATPQETRVERHYENPFFAGVYDRITNQVYRNRLSEIKVDREGDGKTDEVLIFFRRRPDVVLSANGIGIYEGNWASDLIGNRREYIPLPDELPTSEDYRNVAKKVLEDKGYPSEMIDGFDF